MKHAIFATVVLVSLAISRGLPAAPPAALQEAQQLLLGGNYAEAQDAFEAAIKREPIAAAVGVVRCLVETGKIEEAEKRLLDAITDEPKSATLHAESAQLAFDRGDYETAELHAKSALALDPKCLPAPWVLAELHRVRGKLDEANAAYKWFVDHYNDTDKFDDPDDLRLIGLAAAQYARWNRISDQFGFLVNDLLPSALELEKNYWPAKLASGRLFLEKYNESDAQKDLKAALALNPQSAEVHTALAELAMQNYNLEAARASTKRALELRPGYVPALQAAADAHLMNFEYDEAIALLEQARKINAVEEGTLGRLAAVYAVVDGWSDAAASSARFKKIVDEVNARNPHAGEFYLAMARTFDHTRRFPAAAQYYRTATEKMPQLTTPYGELGLMLMRLGEEADAKKLLDQSFEIDPFNVRVSNSRKVLEVLEEYAILETPHFIIRFDRVKDEILAKYAADYLENEVYPELTKKFGFEPEGKSLFEIFNRSRNTNGHGWFSARMVGLPYIGTVGACAGKMVALASPNDMPKKFNWARVLKHEFVHVLNLQQSRFNIPHWYTEALAVESEGGQRPAEWNELLAERVPKGEMFNLDTINLGFVRPKTSLNWTMAYCQAQLYAQYMVKTYGDDALAKMLQCYRDNLTTKEALRKSFDVDQASFERGYLEFVRNIAKDLSPGEKTDGISFSMASLLKLGRDDPGNPDHAAKLALIYLQQEKYPDARRVVDDALKNFPKHQQANYVRARLHLVVGEEAEATKRLEDSLDREKPDSSALSLLASLKYKAGDTAAAEELYDLGHKKFPHDAKWSKALTKIYLITKNESKLETALKLLADADYDDLIVRKKLAQMALNRGDPAEARRWAIEAIQCDVLDAAAHRTLAAALEKLEKPAAAMAEFETLVKLESPETDDWAGLVRTAKAAGKDEIAERARTRLKQIDPEHEALKK